MKKMFSILVVLALAALMLTGCASTPKTDSGVAVITIKGNVTTGRQWVLKEAGENVKVSEGEYKTDEAPSGMMGVGGTYTFAVQGVKEGSCSIVFNCVGPDGETVEDTKTCTATVDSKLRVTIKE